MEKKGNLCAMSGRCSTVNQVVRKGTQRKGVDLPQKHVLGKKRGKRPRLWRGEKFFRGSGPRKTEGVKMTGSTENGAGRDYLVVAGGGQLLLRGCRERSCIFFYGVRKDGRSCKKYYNQGGGRPSLGQGDCLYLSLRKGFLRN